MAKAEGEASRNCPSSTAGPTPSCVILALIPPAVALILQWTFWSLLAPFVWLLFYPAVFFSSWLGGLVGGIFATFVSAGIVLFVFIPPQFSFAVANLRSVISVGVFVATGFLFSILHDRLRKSSRATAAALAEADAAKRQLEGLFNERTEQLQESRVRLGAAIASMTDALYITDAGGRFVEFNEAFARFYRFSGKQECARTFAEYPGLMEVTLANGLPAPTDQWAVPRALRGETGRDIEYGIRRKDTLESWVGNYSFAPIRDAEGTIIGSVVSVRDVTEQRLVAGKIRRLNDELTGANAALREGEERYRVLFDNNPVPFWVFDLETLRFLAVNDAAVQGYGYTREEFLGMTLSQIHPLEDITRMLESLRHGRTEEKYFSEWRHRKKDGSVIDVEVSARPVLLDGRTVRLVLAVDITEKKQLKAKLVQIQRLESLGMLAAGIAHDLNNILTPIVCAAPILREALTNPHDIKILNTLESSAERGTGLVKQILGFAHATTAELEPTQVKHLARDVIGVIEETFPKNISLRHLIPSDLWPVQGNATQIYQVLLNLCVNARDAMPKGGTLRLTAANRFLDAEAAYAIPSARPGAWVLIEVDDTGSGIPPDVLARIWEPFFTTKGLGKGTGLGLSTVRGIVATHRGFVDLHTEAGRGSTFRIFLPALLETKVSASAQ